MSTTSKSMMGKRRYFLVAAFICICLLGGAGFYLLQDSAADVPAFEPVYSEFALAAAAPLELHIPKLSVSVPFGEPLGLQESGAVMPPAPATVGYYTHGSTPGELGASVVLGHSVAAEGSAVFGALGRLLKGDAVEIYREDGTVATFVVTELERLAPGTFPTEKVYGAIEYAGLRLLTCTEVSTVDSVVCEHDLVVYARLFKETQ